MALKLLLVATPITGAAHAHDARLIDARMIGVEAAGACEAAMLHAEAQYRLPRGMLFAIGLAESGRLDPATRRVRPWPWAVQAGDKSLYFETKPEAIAWVQAARVRGAASIDTGCLQVSLLFHPQAFATLEAAFDPESNVDYAARFLVKLHEETNDWAQAIGFYHSRTPALGLPYQQHVQITMGLRPTGDLGPNRTPLEEDSVAAQLSRAWGATGEPAAPAEAKLDGNSWSTLLQPSSRINAASRPRPRTPTPTPTSNLMTELVTFRETGRTRNTP